MTPIAATTPVRRRLPADGAPSNPGALEQREPARLASVPVRKRKALREAIETVAIFTNRCLDRFAVGRLIHDRVMKGLEKVDVRLPLPATAAGLDGMRLVFVSDLHAGSYLDRPRLANLFGEIQEIQPDLVCLGGDLINTRASEIELYDEALARLDPTLGVYAVTGNHDRRWARDIGHWQDFLQGHGVRVLGNDGLRLERGGSTFWLGGVDDLTDGAPSVESMLRGRADQEPTIVLAHQPDHFRELAEHDVNLVLSGHTHGGQVRPFGWAPIQHTKHGWLAGGYSLGSARLHVSRGAGTTVLPLRWHARPEITVVTFEVER